MVLQLFLFLWIKIYPWIFFEGLRILSTDIFWRPTDFTHGFFGDPRILRTDFIQGFYPRFWQMGPTGPTGPTALSKFLYVFLISSPHVHVHIHVFASRCYDVILCSRFFFFLLPTTSPQEVVCLQTWNTRFFYKKHKYKKHRPNLLETLRNI